MVYSAGDLKELYPEQKTLLQEKFIDIIKNNLLQTTFFFTIMEQTRMIYSLGWDKALSAHEFMKKSLLSYSYWCAWKQFQQCNRSGNSFRPFIDEFDGEETIAWYNLIKAKPCIFYRGDMSNPLIATCDVILEYLDNKLRKQKLSDVTIEQELKNLGLNGQKQYIGIPDLHNITATSSNHINKTQFRAKPTYYIVFEDRPTQLNKKEWTDSKTYSGMVDFAIKNAFENNGCIKFYDHKTDSKVLNSRDYFIWCSEGGKQIVDAVGKANGTKEIYYHGQKGI